jgi:pyruvate/2-oxoglutarate dehydrogenase complex dihydrolipoamide acyltransferase (E2) component
LKDEQSIKIAQIEGTNQNEKILASPAVRQLIRMHGLNSTTINGSGPNGRIVKEDIYKLIKGAPPLKSTKSEKVRKFKIKSINKEFFKNS